MNLVILIGRLGQDPETRYTQDGKAITSFSMATSEKWKDKNTGETREETEWHEVVCFGRQAEVAGEYLSKGSQVCVRGKKKTDVYEKDGIKKYFVKIHISPFGLEMLGSRPDRDDSYHNQGPSGYDGHNQTRGADNSDIPF